MTEIMLKLDLLKPNTLNEMNRRMIDNIKNKNLNKNKNFI